MAAIGLSTLACAVWADTGVSGVVNPGVTLKGV